MGSYINSILTPQEKIMTEGKVHWGIYLRSVFLLVLGLVIGIEPLDLFLMAFAVIFAVGAFITQKTTELVVTDKRVIAKFGFIQRQTIQIGLDKVEGVRFDQSIFGRLLDYGSIHVSGTGTSNAPIPYIACPTDFRKTVDTILYSKENR